MNTSEKRGILAFFTFCILIAGMLRHGWRCKKTLGGVFCYPNGIALKKLQYLIAAGMLLLSTCSSGSSSDTATISISLNKDYTPGKAAVSVDQLIHKITLTGPTGSQTHTIVGGGSVKATVAPGTWEIEVKGFFENELYATGSATAEVKAGQTTDVLIQMTVVWTGHGTGAGSSGGGGTQGGGSKTYTVTFNSNGGTGQVPQSETGIYGSSITLPGGTGLSYGAYLFGGWNTNNTGTGTNYSAGTSYTVMADITLYAKWDTSPIYSINLSQTGPYTFSNVGVGYLTPPSLTVTIINTGNSPTGTLNISLSGTDMASFGLSTNTVSDLAPGANTTFDVEPVIGLSVGSYTATVTISNATNGINESFNLDFSVISTSLSGTIAITATGINSGNKSLSGEWLKDQTLTASFTGNSSGTPTWVWKRGGTTIGTNSPNYTLVELDRGQTITVEVSFDGNSGSPVTETINIHPGIPITSIINGAGGIQNLGDSYILVVNNAPVTLQLNPFSGTFDGNGNTVNVGISETLSTIATNDIAIGLFGSITGTVKNLRLEGTINYTYSGGGTVDICSGAVAGINMGTICNVSSSVDLTIISNSSGVVNVGGIAGVSDKEISNPPGKIINCYSTGSSSGTATGNMVFAAGILARYQEGEVRYCWAEGTVNSNGSSGNASGIVSSYGGPGSTTNNVALHAALILGTPSLNGRIMGGQSNSGLSDNYANSAMGNVASFPAGDGATGYSGADVTIAQTEATGGSWWTGPSGGPLWTTANNWGGASADEDKPWKWDAANMRPILWFETTLNQ